MMKGRKFEEIQIPLELPRKVNWLHFISLQGTILALLLILKYYNYDLFHFFVEGYTIAVSLSIYLIVVNSKYALNSSFLKILSIGYLFISILDSLHTLSYKGMSIFSGYDSNLPTQLWIFSRYTQSIMILSAVSLSRKKVKIFQLYIVSFLLMSTGLYLIFTHKFPNAFIEGVGLTPFKITSEYIITTIFFISLLLLLRNKKQYDPYLLKYISVSLLFSILSELMFTLYSGPFDLLNLTGHYFKFIAVFFIYKAVIQQAVKYPQMIIFRELSLKKEELEKEVRENVAKLEIINKSNAAMIDSFQEYVIVFDNQFILKECYIPHNDIFHLYTDQMIGKSLDDISLPALAIQKIKGALIRVLKTGEPERVEYCVELINEQYWFDALVSLIPGENTVTDRLLCTVRDITSRVKLEEVLYNEKEQFKTTLLSVGDGIIATDRNGRIEMMNPVAERLTGWTQQMAYKKTVEEVFSILSEDMKEAKDITKTVLKTESINKFSNQNLLISKNGKEIPVEVCATPILDRNKNITGVVIVFRDCTERIQKQREIEYLSFHDHLTGLFNRRYLEISLKKLDIEQNLPITIMILDVNGLKLTNDAFGHEEGDKLIKAVADLLTDICRKEGIVARIGGDEFAVLLPNTDKAIADYIKKRIIEKASNTTIESIVLSLSIGYSVKSSMDRNIAEVQKEADNNMYKDKIQYGKAMRSQTIEILLRNINNKYDSEQIHTERVSQYCVAIAKAMKLSDKEISDLKIAGVLHDIGKIIVPPELLNKKSKLTDNEFEMIRQHSQTGYQILKGTDEYALYAEAVLYHHERWDGNGYPRGLKGSEIPLYSRIISVADSYEAMTAKRSYQKSKSNEEAIEEIKKCSGSQFDPDIAKVFVDKVLHNE